MSGKGSGRRPGVMPEGAWETIFKKPTPPSKCPVCNENIPRCVCNGTDDGPGQEGGCRCVMCTTTEPHASDCAVHNGPSMPIGKCDCRPLPYERRRFERNG